ncbi:hypothetical protein [Paraburkholderia guartelaensis]|uniref:hypothetical protein n=1 Tax=Paraburkholderia guartelaensis TaxID=2546446 RepID=UPI002AB606AC|nr:hypothetical protein [Paraburkholderia guartelaensis]
MLQEKERLTAPSAREVFGLVNLYLIDTLAHLVSVLHDPKPNNVRTGDQSLTRDGRENLNRARIRLDGARIIFDFLTRPEMTEEQRKSAVQRIMANISGTWPQNCRDDDVHQRQFAAIFGLQDGQPPIDRLLS